MKKFAQIIDNKAYWIFDAEEAPTFAPNIVLLDITEKGEVHEGDFYDTTTDTFSEIPKIADLSLKELQNNQLIIMDAISDIYILLVSLTQPD
ncbi:hypothetical protein [Candidatus Formimonas warabiya]|uniref:Uncharacterized protein n=1 Tax=Formimonas warabiya TaxID=1761012 RepID=A0A3G1KZI8_FORW1|nr:hypothetical protein [Candidatus Formimonas warabiya]ATW27953.1 hypothetical protein DCMF_27215 [Candidatus Formimonas warabiya]